MTIRTYQCLTLLHIFLSEEELSVKIRQVDGIEVEERNVPEACEHDILHCSVSANRKVIIHRFRWVVHEPNNI